MKREYALWITGAVIACIAIIAQTAISLAAIADARATPWHMPAGERRVVVCEGARLAMHPINPTQALLWCMTDDSPLPTPLPPRP